MRKASDHVLNQLSPYSSVTELKVYQIGVGSFGRYGFEKLIELHKEFDTVNVELKGVCDSDFDKLEMAEKFAKSNGIDIETFASTDEMYKHAARQDDKVMVYDAGAADTHADHIYRSMQHGLFHLAEKPPSMSRGEHLKEKSLAEKNQAMWKCDFIERESPVVKKALELLEDEEIQEIKVFRESSAGVQKVLDPVNRMGVKGGDILDKMVHEVYVLDMLDAAGQEIELELENAEAKYFLPKNRDSEKLMSIYNGYTETVNYETATGQTHAVFDANGTKIELNSSWLGMSDKTMFEVKKLHDFTGHDFFNGGYSDEDNTAFVDEECRFFMVEGSRRLAGDMLHEKLFDLETGEEIELDYYIHDQLYRVIEKAVLKAGEEPVETISEKEIDVFMNAVFDVKEEAAEGEFLEERDKAMEKLESMLVTDRKIIETKEADSVAG